jgi:hypothetical protein
MIEYLFFPCSHHILVRFSFVLFFLGNSFTMDLREFPSINRIGTVIAFRNDLIIHKTKMFGCTKSHKEILKYKHYEIFILIHS